VTANEAPRFAPQAVSRDKRFAAKDDLNRL
jgi:hypothetical protein